jgi:hypothetical protein
MRYTSCEAYDVKCRPHEDPACGIVSFAPAKEALRLM